MPLAKATRIKLFNGPRFDTENAVNEFLRKQSDTTVLLGVEYNYQGPEVNAKGNQISEPSHGVLLMLQDVREG
jgi:hypothetical protein